jgi:hypothetical protein
VKTVPSLFAFRIGEIGGLGAGDPAQFTANDIGGKACSEEAAIKRCGLALIDCAASSGELALQARACERCLVRFRKDMVESGLDVAFRHTAGTQLACDAKRSLATSHRVLPSIFERIAGIVKVVLVAKTRDDRPNFLFVLCTAAQILTHLVNRMRPSR